MKLFLTYPSQFFHCIIFFPPIFFIIFWLIFCLARFLEKSLFGHISMGDSIITDFQGGLILLDPPTLWESMMLSNVIPIPFSLKEFQEQINFKFLLISMLFYDFKNFKSLIVTLKMSEKLFLIISDLNKKCSQNFHL